jgi:hypothetical protein
MWNCERTKKSDDGSDPIRLTDVSFELRGALAVYPHGEESETILSLSDNHGENLAHLQLDRGRSLLNSTDAGILAVGHIVELSEGYPPYVIKREDNEQWSLSASTE